MDIIQAQMVTAISVKWRAMKMLTVVLLNVVDSYVVGGELEYALLMRNKHGIDEIQAVH